MCVNLNFREIERMVGKPKLKEHEETIAFLSLFPPHTFAFQ